MWPGSEDAFWPEGIAENETLQTFVDLFRSIGYEVCVGADREDGYEKVALYALGDEPTHAARQLTDGRWASKLGVEWEDIEHATLQALECKIYGRARVVLRRLRT